MGLGVPVRARADGSYGDCAVLVLQAQRLASLDRGPDIFETGSSQRPDGNTFLAAFRPSDPGTRHSRLRLCHRRVSHRETACNVSPSWATLRPAILPHGAHLRRAAVD